MHGSPAFMSHPQHIAPPPIPQEISEESLKQHVYMLAGEIGERNIQRPESLISAAHYISRQWQAMGYEIYTQGYRAKNIPCTNIEITRQGTETPEKIIVVGAHYDSIPGSPGANANASGVATLIELARMARSMTFKSTIKFVALVNQEPPFFGTEYMGSWIYAHQAHMRGDDIQLAILLDSIGNYTDAPNSQHYPPFLGSRSLQQGNFLTLLSNLKSRHQGHRLFSSFRRHSNFPIKKIVAPRFIPGMSWGDQSPFWLHHYNAVMLTDTGPYRSKFYHSGRDTPEKLNYAAMQKLSSAIMHSLASLAQG